MTPRCETTRPTGTHGWEVKLHVVKASHGPSRELNPCGFSVLKFQPRRDVWLLSVMLLCTLRNFKCLSIDFYDICPYGCMVDSFDKFSGETSCLLLWVLLGNTGDMITAVLQVQDDNCISGMSELGPRQPTRLDRYKPLLTWLGLSDGTGYS